MSYEKVVTNKEREQFNEEWKKICDERGATYFDLAEDEEAFFIKDILENIVGTCSFLKKNEKNSMVKKYHDFSKEDAIKKDENVYEVGKISIKKGYRRDGHLEKIILLIAEHSAYNKINNYIGAMDSDLYGILAFQFGIRLKKVGKPTPIQEKRKIYNVIANVEELLNKIQQNSKFDKLFKHLNEVKAETL